MNERGYEKEPHRGKKKDESVGRDDDLGEMSVIRRKND